MALSPADFVAYSRATGTPYPEDPEERAELAPQVAEFRRNQLRAPQQEANLPAAIGASVLGLGALGAAVAGSRRFARGAKRPSAVAVDEAPVRRAAQPKTYGTPAPSSPPPPTPGTPPSSEGVAPPKYVEIPFSDVSTKPASRTQIADVDVPAAEERAQTFAQTAVDDLVSAQQRTIPSVAENTFDALESGSDQLDTKLESQVQRDVDSVRYSKPIVAIEKYTGVVDQLTPRQQRLMTEMSQVGAPKSSLDDPRSTLKRASYEFEMNDWSDGPPEHLLDDLGNFLRQQEARNTPLSGFNLSGAIGDLPGVSAMSAKERKLFGKQIDFGADIAISDLKKLQGPAILNLQPSKLRTPTGFFGTDIDMSDFEGPVQGPAIKSYAAPERISPGAITDIERADRISAAANYTPGSYEHQLLLNPTVPTEKIRGLLGSTLRVEQGRVGRNLTHEITPGARASMTEVPGWKDEQAARRAQRTQEVVYDEYGGDTPYTETVSWEDYERATDLGEGEGPGGLTLSRTFDERTGKSRTDLPGQYQLAYGGPQSPRAVRPLGGVNQELYARQERIDRVMPTRSTEEGDTSRGFRIDPNSGRLVLEGASERGPMGRLQPTDPTMMAEGDYEDKLVTKLVGGFQGATGDPARMVSTQPTSAYYEKDVVGKADPRIEKGSDGRLYVRSGQSQITGEEPLVAFVGTRTTNPDGSQGPYTFLEKQGLKQVQLPLDTLTEIVQDAKNTYLNNPSAKKAFLERRNPELLEQGMKEGKLLSEMGNAITYNDFLIESLDKGLQARGYKLPILQQSKKGFYPKAAHEFISNVGQVTKESPVFGYPAVLGPSGGIVYENTKYGKVPKVDKSKEPRPIPGLLDIRGTGGADPMSIADDYEGATAYHAPRLESAPQVVRQRSTGQLLTATQAAQSPQGLISTGETVPQLSPIARPQFTTYPNVAMRTVKTPGGEGTYVATEFLPPVSYEIKVDPETGLRYPTTNIISQERTVERAPQVPNQSTALSLGTTGQKLVDLRRQMETSPKGYQAPYLSNIGGGFIANTKNPFTSNARYATGSVGGPLPKGSYLQLEEPRLTRFGYLNPNERGIGASRNLNLEMPPRATSQRYQSPGTTAEVGDVSTYDINQAMTQLQAQAARRRGAQRS